MKKIYYVYYCEISYTAKNGLGYLIRRKKFNSYAKAWSFRKKQSSFGLNAVLIGFSLTDSGIRVL